MESKRIIQLLLKRYQGRLHPAEENQLNEWLSRPENRREADELTRAWELSGRYGEGYEPDAAAGLRRLRLRMERDRRPALLRRRGRMMMIAAAAVLLVLVWWKWEFSPAFSNPVTTVQTGPGQHLAHTLPDGSTVNLNENSRITYLSRMEENARRLTLAGEAFFTVTRRPDRPFVVETSEALVKVLGTAFNVRAYLTEPAILVSVESGQVTFSAGDGPPLTLQAREKGIWQDGRLFIQTDPGDNARAWQTGRLSFRNTPLPEIVRSFEHYLGLRVDLADPGLANCRFTFAEITRRNAAEVLQTLALAIGAELVPKGENHYELKGKGCE